MKAFGSAAEARHAGLVAEDRAAGAGRARVDREHRDPVALRPVRFEPSASISVDLPTPGTPVMPTRTALPVCGISRVEERSRRGAVVGALRFDRA